MKHSHSVSLLVAALVMLRYPCARNKATARLLLERAAEHAALTPAEREACRNLADDLDNERPDPAAMRTTQTVLPRPVTEGEVSFPDNNIMKPFLAYENHSRL